MKILMIVEPDRKDWYQYLTTDIHNEYCLLWHETETDIPVELKQNTFFKKIYSWSSYTTPQELLRKIRPDRIVFFEIIDQRQISLMVTANKAGIKTFYLEHGAAGNREAAIRRADEKNYFSKTKRHYLVNRLRTGLGRMIKSKIFYYAAGFQLSSLSSTVKYLRLPLAMLLKTPNKALADCIFPERTPFKAIVFNKPNFEQFQVYTGITEDKAVFTGVPIFDHFYSKAPAEGNHITYIESPFLADRIFGWSEEHQRKIALVLYEFALKRRIKMVVKLHPRSDISKWQNYELDLNFLEIVQFGDFTQKLLESKLILAFGTSMVNGFLCAKKNVVLLGWHPQPKIIGVDFSKTGLCHASLDTHDLETKFEYWIDHNLCKGKESEYNKFLREFNFPFDGRAGERVLKVITSNEIS